MNRQYPCLTAHLSRLEHNAKEIVERCNAAGIEICGVIKGCNGMPEVARVMRKAGVRSLGTSRLEQIVRCREAGVEGPYCLIRIPAMSELPDVVRWSDVSLQSELATLDALEAECVHQGKTHAVIVMADLGDLREGYWDKDEMVRICLHAEKELPHLHLLGVGVNLSCYGSIKPTPDKMEQMLDVAHRVEDAIGRKLEIVSGGATSSYTLVHWGTMPAGINHLRIGENILLGKDLQLEWGITDMDYLRMDTFTVKAEVIEVKTKPSMPQGEFCIDAFGRRPVYTDHGIQRRALLALGRADVGDLEALIPCMEGVSVIGGSSDHCILNITDCPQEIKVGDILEFRLAYVNLLYASGREDVRICVQE